MKIQVYRKGLPTLALPLNQSTFNKVLMGNHELVFSAINSPIPLGLQVGDYLTYKGEMMTINSTPEYSKESNNSHLYQVTFQGVRHNLSRYVLKHLGSLKFDYTATLSGYANMFISFVNTMDSGWSVGDIEDIEPFYLVFDKVDCLSAVTMIAEAAGCEWQLVGKTLHIKKKVGIARALSFSYGKGKGLYSLTRKHVDGSSIISRAYAFGGQQNLPQGYPHDNLTVPGFVEDPAAINAFGVREGVYENEEIFPNRIGTATAVGQINEGTFTLTDSTLDFDLEGLRILGTEAKIAFTSGALNGQQFKILAYNATTKTIRYEANKDTKGELLPRGGNMAQVGDKYILLGIRMPQSYVDEALTELTSKRLEFLNDNKSPKVRYEFVLDILKAKNEGYILEEGDIIRLVDADISLDDDVRVISVSYPGHFPFVIENGMSFTCEIGNEVHYQRLSRIENNIKETAEVVTTYRNQSVESNRRSVSALNEFRNMVFDPDGNMEQPMIEAMAGLFGTKSQMFDLNGVTITENYLGDPNKLLLSEGNLIHYAYDIPTVGNVWNITQSSLSGLVSDKAYYIALKASRTVATATWDVSLVKRSVDEDPDHWYFNFGVITRVIENNRSIRPTNMFTAISGGTVETNILIAKVLMLPYMSIGKNGENAQRFYYDIEQKKTAAIFGVVDGIPKLVWYDEETGEEIWNASKNGIIYVTNTPETWTAYRLLEMHGIATEDEALDEITAQDVLTMNAVKDGIDQVYISGGVTAHFYDAGVNDDTAKNIVYEGYHTSDSKSAAFVPNGYYYITSAFAPDKEYLLSTGADTYRADVVKLWNGKMKGGFISVEIMVY